MSLVYFKPTEKETKLEAKWLKKHNRSKCVGSTQYVLTETGIGMAVEIKCQVCGNSQDISDYSSW